MKFLLLLLLAAALLSSGFPPADLELSKGKFLIATNKLSDPRFQQTVVLLIHYARQGSMGLIVNHPTDAPVSEAIEDVPSLDKLHDPVFIGGPVDLSLISFLLLSHDPPEGALRIFDHLYYSNSKDVLEEQIDSLGSGKRMRVYAGYAGWGSGQLETEIMTGHWFVWHADSEIVFAPSPKKVWQEMIRRSSVLQAYYPIKEHTGRPL